MGRKFTRRRHYAGSGEIYRLIAMRRFLGISQSEAAGVIKRKACTLGLYETCRYRMRRDDCMKLINYYKRKMRERGLPDKYGGADIPPGVGLKVRLKLAGFSIVFAAKEAGLSVTTAWRMLSGRRAMPEEVYAVFAGLCELGENIPFKR